MAPSTTFQWALNRTSSSFDGLEFENVPLKELGDTDVLVKFHAVSLNYRDIMIATGSYYNAPKEGVVLCSDASGEIIDVGINVSRFHKSQRVATTFFQNFVGGSLVQDGSMKDLGCRVDGVLRQYGCLNEQNLVEIPPNLNFFEASTLPCAYLTAWNCLFGGKQTLPGDIVLTQGTGGVSLAAVQFGLAVGAQVIATTSSAEKAKVLHSLGVKHVINYAETKEWGNEAKQLSIHGRGVNHVVEIGGMATMNQSILAASIDAEIAVVGTRGGAVEGVKNHLKDLHSIHCCIRRIFVGNRLQFEQMNRAIETSNIKPVIDKVFKFRDLKAAFQYMTEQNHVGKVVIEID